LKEIRRGFDVSDVSDFREEGSLALPRKELFYAENEAKTNGKQLDLFLVQNKEGILIVLMKST
jgi:hypothetical protein